MTGPWRDGAVHVLADRCSTCVFRPGNLMRLSPGRLKDLIACNVEADAALTCHQTLPGSEAPPAVCRGFADAHPTTPLRLAGALGLLVYDPIPGTQQSDADRARRKAG